MPERTVRIVGLLYSGFARFALLLHASCLSCIRVTMAAQTIRTQQKISLSAVKTVLVTNG